MTSEDKSHCSVILLSAGVGSRFGGKAPKQFHRLKGKPIIAYSLKRLEEQLPFKELIISCNPLYEKTIKKIVKRYTPKLFPLLIFSDGGNTRQESVYKALLQTTGERILLHESARPCPSKALFCALMQSPEKNITPGVAIPFTVLKKSNKNEISELINRDDIFNVQLPQRFERKTLLKAHQKAAKEGRSFTDDSSLLFYYGTNVKVIEGEITNIKITHPSDIIQAKQTAQF